MVVTRRGTDTEQASPNNSADELSVADPLETREDTSTPDIIDGGTVSHPSRASHASGNTGNSSSALNTPSPLLSSTMNSPVFAATPERIAAEDALADSENEEDRIQERIEADLMHPDTERRQFRDLLVFEERLRQNAARLRAQQQRSEMFLGALVLVTAILGWFAIVQPSEDVYLRVLVKCLLAASVIGMIALCYTEPMTQASKFLPQCNRALISINIQLGAHGLQFHRSVPRRLRDGYAAFRDAYHQRRRAPSSTFTRGSTTLANDHANHHRTTPRRRGPT